MNQFTQQDTEVYYDENDGAYRALWDCEGRIHWGYFEKTNQNDFKRAGHRMTELMIKKAGINQYSKILDIGCGNGTVTIDIVKQCGCEAAGIDLSGVHIQNALSALEELSDNISSKLHFEQGSATQLPHPNETFTHIWSTGTIYHIHEKEKALQEIHRVLQSDGTFVFADLFKPKPDISKQTKKLVYEGLKFDTPFSFTSYKDFLKEVGFEIVEAQDLSQQLKQNYGVLADMVKKKLKNKEDNQFQTVYQVWHKRYRAAVTAVEQNELGWGFFICRK